MDYFLIIVLGIVVISVWNSSRDANARMRDAVDRLEREARFSAFPACGIGEGQREDGRISSAGTRSARKRGSSSKGGHSRSRAGRAQLYASDCSVYAGCSAQTGRARCGNSRSACRRSAAGRARAGFGHSTCTDASCCANRARSDSLHPVACSSTDSCEGNGAANAPGESCGTAKAAAAHRCAASSCSGSVSRVACCTGQRAGTIGSAALFARTDSGRKLAEQNRDCDPGHWPRLLSCIQAADLGAGRQGALRIRRKRRPAWRRVSGSSASPPTASLRGAASAVDGRWPTSPLSPCTTCRRRGLSTHCPSTWC